MKHRWLWISFLFVTSLLGFFYLIRPQPDKVVAVWESTGQPFKVRVTASDETFFLLGLPGRWFRYEALPSQQGDWQEIMWFRHDDPIPIPTEQVRFVNDHIAYAFIGWAYAVTTNGGKSWSAWDASKDWKTWQCCNYRLIEDVRLAGDGKGEMSIHVIDPNRGEVPRLYTRNFGRSWQKEP